jgi:hypothetical protein
MNISQESLDEFRVIWKEEVKEDISDDFARERAGELLELYLALSEPLPVGRSLVVKPDPVAEKVQFPTLSNRRPVDSIQSTTSKS